MKKKIEKEVSVKNKKASFQYHLVKKYTAGIVLKGTEVKAVRMGQVSISEAYCYFMKEELFIKNMNISEYEQGSVYNHMPKRERKLLLNRKELSSIHAKIKIKGYTIVPTELFVNDRGFVKVEIALAQGKKVFDKRDQIKRKDIERSMDRSKKEYL